MSHIDVAPAGVGIDLLMDVQRRLRLLRHRQLDVIIHSLSLSLSLSTFIFFVSIRLYRRQFALFSQSSSPVLG